MPFAIVADMPLGTYRGAGQDGRPERIPSVARLHSALLCAAGFGPRAVPRDDGLDICEPDAVALSWLEENPPDSVHIPALEINVGQAIAYRDDGTLKKSKSGTTIKKLGKAPYAGTATGGRFAWFWQEPPPEPVREAIELLCPDVAYLGTAESPVRLTALSSEYVEATHDLAADAGLFDAGVLGVERPLPGRLQELAAAHREANGKPPPAGRDRPGTDEKSLSPTPPRSAVESARYRPRQTVSADVPWPRVLVLPLRDRIDGQDRIRWAVAAHRALVKLIGYGAPALVTGTYPPGVPRPANRLALHLLSQDMPSLPSSCRGPAALAMLVPWDADPADLIALHRAVEGLTSVRGPGGKVVRVDRAGAEVVDGSRFWLAPEPGHIRLWRTAPAAVPDTRGCGGQEWTFAHAALLSLGFAWKGFLPAVPGRGESYYRGLAAAISDHGAVAVHARAVRTSDVSRYVHKVNEHAVVRPYTAYLSLGHLTGPGTLQAIGQSRHLGGGLLVPFDVPEGIPVGGVTLPGDGSHGSGS